MTPSFARWQKQGLQVVQKIKATHCGFDTHQVTFDQALALRLSQILFNCAQGQTGALKKQLQCKPVFQTQGVEHELKRQIDTTDFFLLRQAVARQGFSHVQRRLTKTHLAHYRSEEHTSEL